MHRSALPSPLRAKNEHIPGLTWNFGWNYAVLRKLLWNALPPMAFFDVMKSLVGDPAFWLMPTIIEGVLRQHPASSHPGKTVLTPTQVFPHQKTLPERCANPFPTSHTLLHVLAYAKTQEEIKISSELKLYLLQTAGSLTGPWREPGVLVYHMKLWLLMGVHSPSSGTMMIWPQASSYTGIPEFPDVRTSLQGHELHSLQQESMYFLTLTLGTAFCSLYWPSFEAPTGDP
ncbi:uncharacterized protein LOC131829104 [Mustela lutreola]|uniref:uncharacterized protein LOC131829104 n=1 Tax=Mustela lutreola TaxID=9666 RepID=UPI002797BBA5|nr:uncharacterized protein LOC131829104 [Mustela lutreola]